MPSPSDPWDDLDPLGAMSHRFPAAFESACACGGWICEGDMVVMLDGQAICTDCADQEEIDAQA